MFTGIRGTSIAMLGIDRGVLVGADKRAGNTLSNAISDGTSKILPIHPAGLVTGCGLAALQSEDDQHITVDIFRMFRRLCRYPQFQFQPADFHRIGQAWMDLMSDHLKNCAPRHWPETPPSGYWFRSLFVHQRGGTVGAWDLDFEYERLDPRPRLDCRLDSIKDDFVNQGHLLMEGDQRGAGYLDRAAAVGLFLPETHKAWTSGIDPIEVNIEKGARILKDALFANHLCSTRADGERSVGDTCDIAFVDREVGFRWYEQNASTAPPSLSALPDRPCGGNLHR
jgi:hypothetical protein